MIRDKQTLTDCVREINSAERIVITAHPKPDGDALGSALGLKYSLKEVGKQVAVTGLTPVPNRYKSFVREGDLQTIDEALEIKPDLIVALDAGAFERIPEELRELRGQIKIMNMDHHISNDGFGDINFIDVEACSTGEIVYMLIKEGAYPIDSNIASLLWVAVVTDTGRFAYSNTSTRALQAAAGIVKYGVDTELIDRVIYRQLTREELIIHKIAMENLEFIQDGKISFTSLTVNDFDNAGCVTADTEDIIEIPRCIIGVEVAILFYEDKEKPDRINVSMRANGDCDLAELCGSLGGGGHKKAAGCRIRGNMDYARELVLQTVEKWLEMN